MSRFRASGRLVAGGLATVLAATACGGTSSPSGSGGSSSGAPAAPSATAGGSLKPVLSGLVTFTPPSQQYQGQIRNFVVQANWSDLQPQQGGPIAPDNAIDRGIAIAQQQHLGIKVRIFAGIHAPDWAKNIDGPPIPIHAPVDNVSGTIGRFWTADFGKAYDDLVTKLAAKYDSVPEVLEVVAARCTTVYSEPFIRDAADSMTVHNLLAAGFSVDADRTCDEQMIDAHKVFVHTRTGVAFNEYEHINPDGSSSLDLQFTEQLIAYCRQSLGRRCSVENNALRATSNGPLYQYFKQVGPPIAFQTDAGRHGGNLPAALQIAAQVGASSVEINNTFLADVDVSQVQGPLQSNANAAGG